MAEWPNGGMADGMAEWQKEWQNGRMAEMDTYVLAVDRFSRTSWKMESQRLPRMCPCM